nr:hypothetical protein [Tanacetum cinerariifolium]
RKAAVEKDCAVVDLSAVSAGADLLAGEHVVQDQHRNPRRSDAVSAGFHAGELQGDLHRRELVQRLYQLAVLRLPEYRDIA